MEDNQYTEYLFIFEKNPDPESSNDDIIYTLKHINDLNYNEKYIYDNINIHNNLELGLLNTTSTDDQNNFIDDYITENNIITLYVDNIIDNYYDLLSTKVFADINTLQEQLQLKKIDYNELNQKILNKINQSIETIKQKIQINNKERFYFYLKYNVKTYYQYNQELRNYIDEIITNIHNNYD